ncbi:MAG TPA: hypothetical protein VGQ44_14950 [Gemmatimonadaceae bacterium]|nr:hypothetical protein [Gemmatimonadaceae bacterium]
MAAFAVATSCYHWAEVTTSWGAPGRRRMQFDNVVAVFASSDDRLRIAMENRIVAEFPRGTPSYRALAAIDLGDAAAVRAVFDDDQFDAAIIMTVVLADPRPTSLLAADLPRSRHPLPARTIREQWDRLWNPPFDPASVPPKRLVAIEVQVYSLRDDHLVWAGRGDPGDAKAIAKLGDAAVANLSRELAREGILAYALPPHQDGFRVAE